MPQTIDLINFPSGNDVAQWPKLTCTQPGQLALQDAGLYLQGDREILFQDNGQIRSFDDNHKLVFDRAGSLLELHEAGDIRFLTGVPLPTEKLRIRADGHVGVGTNAPRAKLHVAGALRTDGSLRVTGNAHVAGNLNVGGTTFPEVTDNHKTLDVAGQGLFRSAPWTGAVPGVAGMVIGFDAGNADGTGFLWSHTTAGASTRLWLDGNPIIFAPGAAEQMRIDSSGNVGIGMTAPRRRLDVQGEIVATNRLTLAQDAGNATKTWHVANAADRLVIFDQPNINTHGTERLSIDQTGNVYIHSTGFSTLTVGAGANGAIKVRHVNGKHSQNDTDERLYLNWGTGQHVHVGGGGTTSDLLVEGTIQLPAAGQLYAPGRMHIHGEENLYLLNKGGVIVSRAWGGNGNLMVEGSLRVQSEHNPLIMTGYTNDVAARDILDNSPIYSLMIAVEERPQGTAVVFYWKDGDGRTRKAWDQGRVL